MKVVCPYSACETHLYPNFKYHRTGFYRRKSDKKKVQRYACQICGARFSSATNNILKWHKKRHLHSQILQLLTSGVSLRRISRILQIHPITVTRIRSFLSVKQHLLHDEFLREFSITNEIQMDEMETFEHSKLKPLSIVVVVDSKTRFILSAKVATMPSKGTLTQLSLKKYGKREDHRSETIHEILHNLQGIVTTDASISSDLCPRYPVPVRTYFPSALHIRYPGRRGCVVGQGELKAGGYDELFSINHTCAMFRANINRLFRRTWCTTKKKEYLQEHIDLYVAEHNRVILEALKKKKSPLALQFDYCLVS